MQVFVCSNSLKGQFIFTKKDAYADKGYLCLQLRLNNVLAIGVGHLRCSCKEKSGTLIHIHAQNEHTYRRHPPMPLFILLACVIFPDLHCSPVKIPVLPSYRAHMCALCRDLHVTVTPGNWRSICRYHYFPVQQQIYFKIFPTPNFIFRVGQSIKWLKPAICHIIHPFCLRFFSACIAVERFPLTS